MASKRSSVTHPLRAQRAATMFIGVMIFLGLAGWNASADSRNSNKQAGQVASQQVAPEATALTNLLSVPLNFQPNQGQTDSRVQFLSRGAGFSLFLTPSEAVLNLERQASQSSLNTLRMKLLGANAKATALGMDPLPGVASYFVGSDPKKWHAGVSTFGKVKYAQIYPGVDLVFYGNQRQLEYDFVVAPGADPSLIAWQIDGAKPAIDAEGNLVLTAPDGPASFKKPILYQMDGDNKISVEGSFTVASDQIHFRIGDYDHAKPLIIDPVLSYASYLGGTGTDNIGAWIGPGHQSPTQGVAVDAQGSIYVTGNTYSTDFPTANPYQSVPPTKMAGVTPGMWSSVFVTKFSPDGKSLVYSTYLGGNGEDYGYAIAVDANGNAYVTGSTTSPDFPVTPGAYQTVC